MKNNINFKDFYVKPKLPENMEYLSKLAQNIWSTWDIDAYRLFSRIDPVLFRKFNHNPVKLLQQISESRLQELSQENGFINELQSVYDKFIAYKRFKGSYIDKNGEKKPFPQDSPIAYFSMEYGLHESLPIYSGGLGVLSGDHIKAASDLNLPLIGFGLLYRYGYFLQRINVDGLQEEISEENEWYSKPVQKMKDKDGNDLLFSISVNNENIYLKVWKIEAGTISIYLLDTNIELNSPENQMITDYLYVSDREKRIQQEIVLAYGSVEFMKKLNIKPKIYHLNEGHSSFLIVKRLDQLINEEKFSYEQAKELIRCSTVFTTHTPVPAGNEKFDLRLVHKYLANDITKIGQNPDSFFESGKIKNSNDFWLPALAIRFSKYINGVSVLHSKVSKEMWHSIYPDITEDEMPITAITNGVHIQSWISRGITRLFDRYIGSAYRHMGEKKSIWENVLSIPELEIWEAHSQRKEQLIGFIRERLQQSISFQGTRYGKKVRFQQILNHNFLTIGFARRFAAYKRGNLIINDKERILNILNNKERPVQFIFSGKAHPADENGKAMIKALIDFSIENNVEDRFIFIENYDINVARHLVQGVDVWLNNPLKPQEASGTSGMKAGMNGVINCSIADGWWAECYKPDNGWLISAEDNILDRDIRDKLEANEIYDLIENEIAPLYYRLDKNGVPFEWVQKMKHSIHDVGLGFNIHRMLRDYIDKFYIPEIEMLKEISENNHEKLNELLIIEKKINKHWGNVRFVDCRLNLHEKKIVNCGEMIKVDVKIQINDAPDDLFIVELFYRYNENNYDVVPLLFVKRENNFAYFKIEYQIKGAGKQNFNLRIRPKYCKYKKFFNFVKWYF